MVELVDMASACFAPGKAPVFFSSKTSSQQVYQRVRQDIICCNLAPGSKLAEAEMAQRFGVSRQPIREAFIKLCQDGLIQIFPQRGTFVSKISAKRVKDGRFIREAMEIAIAGQAAQGIGSEYLNRLAHNLEAQEQNARDGNRTRFLALDDDFHLDLARSIDCLAAWENLENIKANMDRVRYLSLSKETPLTTLLAQHRLIFEAIQAQDSVAAKSAVHNHLKELNFSFASLSILNSEWFES